MTAKQIAQVFKDAVLWTRIRAGKITSYAQILRAGDDFYTLTDRDAFSALLNDYFSQDNQLQDIFMDLFDAGLGVQKFAEEAQRSSAKQIVAYFLNIKRYAYHKSDVAKVYLAINAWLVFFGASEEKPSWDICPFCGGAVVSGTCAAKGCKKTTADCLSAMSELEELLVKEQDGVKTKKPVYWDAIKSGSEFNSQYKVKLAKWYNEREQIKRREIEKKNQKTIEAGFEALNVLAHKIELELTKKRPDYNMLLSWLADTPEIKEASKCKDQAFKQKVDEVSAKITSHRINLEQEEKRRTKRKKRRKIIALITSIVLVLLLTGGGLFYFGYFRPLNKYPFYTVGLTAEECEVSGLKNDRISVLRMNEKSASGLFLKSSTVVSVANGAFAKNKYLIKAYLPATIRKIGSDAFSECASLRGVHLASNQPPEITSSTFLGVSAHYYVPQESYAAYLSSPYWSDMKEDIFPDYNNADGYGCILFDSNGGEAVNAVPTHALGTIAPSLPQPEKEGYYFAGWYMQNGTLVRSGQTVVESDIKLTARWTVREYLITFETNGGTFSGTVPESYTMETGAQLPSVKKTGYTFSGWYDNSMLNGKALESIEVGKTGDIKLFAKWTPNTYIIRFETYGGTVFENITVQTGDKVSFFVPALPTTGPYAKGYMFAGWALIQNGNATNGNSDNLLNWTKDGDQYIVPAYEENGYEIVLYAVWETTPMDWFSFDMINGNLIITGLTSSWETYNGVLDKTILYLPEQYGTASLYGIGDGAFENRTEIRTVNIPNTVVAIGDNAFSGCSALRSVISAENVESVGQDVFADTPWIELFDDNSWFRTIGKVLLRYNFLGGYQITEKSFPERVTVIAPGVFKDSRNLVEGKEDEDYLLVIPDRITRIGDEAFANSHFNILEWNSSFAMTGNTIFRGCTFKEMRISVSNFDMGRMFSADDENIMGIITYTGSATEIYWRGTNVSAGRFETTEQAVGKLKTVSLLNFNDIQHVYLNSLNLTSLNFSVHGDVIYLDIWGNGFGSNLYVEADTIETVQADYCQITQLGITSYGNYKGFVAKRIGTLNLYNNKITTLDLDRVESIGTMNMSNNTGMISFNFATVHAERLILTNSSIQELLSKKNGQDVVNESVKILFMPSELTKTYRLAYARFDLMPNLISLDIANNAIEIMSYIAGLKNLRELYLGGNPVLTSNTEMKMLLSASFLPNLTRLNLGGGNTTATAGTILNVVKKCNNLTWLELYAIGVSSSEIASTITQSTHSKLVYLKISHNGFTVVPSSLNYIKKVVIDYNDYSHDA